MTDPVRDDSEINKSTVVVPHNVVAIDAELTSLTPEPLHAELDPAELCELLQRPQLWFVTRQERDFALAALLIREKHLSERALRNALRHWTPFGALSLREFLSQKGIVPGEVLSQVEREGDHYFESMKSQDVGELTQVNLARRTSLLLETLDPCGQVAKLFGLSQIPKNVVGDETRTFRTQFRLIRKLGQGGLGTVWLAVDTSLNRYVAVKEISGTFDSRSAAAARFRREAEITGRLDHPSIVPIHLLGENELDGRIFYVMRFLGNETLADAIREYHEHRELGQESPLAFHRLLTAFVTICQAIAYAHSNKVIHRDLKPQNVALDSFGQVIVLDWGLAKTTGMDDPQAYLREMTEVDDRDQLDTTLAGQVLGTPMYMAPEQASGRLDEIDERTDVYGLGAILFSILTGYAPHELSHESLVTGDKLSNLLELIVDRPTTHPRRINPGIPVALNAICVKAMARDRCLRYPSAEALSEDVQRWLANEPISAMQEPAAKRFQRWMTRHRWLSNALSAAIFLTLVGLAFWGFSSYQHAVAAEQLRLQTAVDVVRDLRAKLTCEVETLSENTRFMSTVPPIQGMIDARRGGSVEQEGVWADQLKVIYRGLLDVNPSYTAITYWHQESSKKNVRVENAEAQRGLERTDLTEFFGRHLPRISELARHEVYVGMPGRLVNVNGPHGTPSKNSTQHVGHCLVSGVGVYDKNTVAKLGGVAIECNLEKILIDHLDLVYSSGIEVYLTDNQGRAVMRFTRENGLQPIEPDHFTDVGIPAVRTFFANQYSSNISVISSTLCAAKVPLSRNRPDHFMGLIIKFPK